MGARKRVSPVKWAEQPQAGDLCRKLGDESAFATFCVHVVTKENVKLVKPRCTLRDDNFEESGNYTIYTFRDFVTVPLHEFLTNFEMYTIDAKGTTHNVEDRKWARGQLPPKWEPK
jgi:hypothetical protein